MIPTLVHFDYLLRIESFSGDRTESLMEAVRSLSRVAACFRVEPKAITRQEVLYYE